MVEQFRALPSQIAGLSTLVTSLGEDSAKVAGFIDQNGPPSGDFSGPIISDLLEPLRTCATVTGGRMRDIGVANTSSGIELNKAAWMYDDQENKNYAALNAVTHDVPSASPVDYGPDTERPGQTDTYDDVTTYNKVETFKLDAPSANKEDVADLVTEVAGWLGDVNETIKSITRTIGAEVNPLDMVVSPLTGNWNELKRIGESYKVAGNAMEATGKNLEAGVKQVGEYWDGKAAIAFEENWARRQIAAMKWEGPVGRIVNDGLTVVANEIREGIKTAVLKLKDMLEDYVDIKTAKGILKNVLKKVPVLGWTLEIADLARKIATVVDSVQEIVRKVEELKNQLQEFLRVVTDPAHAAIDKMNQKLEPITTRIDDGARKVAIANDIASATEINSTLDRPREGYEVGTEHQPWEDG
ncbi:hypothetical protein OG921_02665 [Aldersonia sp. NBC_00410]|uniref:hypothetical protein n=1 Tax=Aldersonia sp. NBC_00410 TaxID=2975954 RepID=UPI00224F9000|nr:hypothetical protein [Aldersonia sp. NBC_00410]MCX5042095.1 hypothetical protein [Aldersonia sp. NBC_00410]